MQDTLIYLTSLKGRHIQNKEPKVRIIGVGDAGTNIVGDLFSKNVQAELVAVNTDWKLMSARHADEKLLIGMDETRGMGCGGDPQKGKKAAIGSMHEIKPFLHGADLTFFVGGLGNGTATGGLPVIAEEARKHGSLTVGFVIVPFFLKGKGMDVAEIALHTLEKHLDTIILLDYNRLQAFAKDLPITKAYAVMNEVVAESISSLIRMIRGTEILQVNFSHLKTIFKDGHFGTLCTVQAEGKDVAHAVDKAFENTLAVVKPKEAARALIYIMGGKELTLANIKGVADHMKKYLDEDAEVVVGMGTQDQLAGKVQVTLVLTRVPFKKRLTPAAMSPFPAA
jgi:cell division protein FtsZ